MPKLSGVVDLNYKQALAGLRQFRGEYKQTAKELGGLQVDLDTAPARRQVRQLSEEEKKAHNEKKRLDKEAADNKRRLDREAANSKKEADREAANANKQGIKDEENARKKASRNLKADILERAKEEQRAQAETDRKAIQGAREVARARRRAVEEGRQALDELGTKFSRSATLAGAGLLGGLGAGVNQFEKLDRQLRNVNSIAQLSESGLQGLSDEVIRLASDPNIRKGPTELAAGLYDVYSVGFKGAGALDILRDSAKGAAAGNTEVAVAVDALTGTLNANIKGATSSRQVMDSLFQTVNDGKVTFPQLAGAIGQTLPFLKSGGVSLQEYGAYMADATAKSQKAEFATVNLTNLIDKLAAPPKEAAAAFDALGIKFGYAELKSKGFSSKMVEVAEKTRGSGDALRKLFPDRQAFAAAQTILADKMVGYNAALEKQKHAMDGVGTTARALSKQNQGLSNDVDQAKKSSEIFGITLAQSLAPAISDTTRKGTALLKEFNSLDKATQSNIVRFTALAGGGLLLVGQLKGVFETVSLVKKVFAGSAASKALDAEATAAHTLALQANTAALLANTQAAGANTLASEAGAAAQATATATTAEGLGAVATEAGAATIGVGGLSAAYTVLLPILALVVAGAGLYAINQQVVNKNNTVLEASNKSLATATKQTAKAFDGLSKSAKGNGDAAKEVAKLRGEYEKMSETKLGKFASVSLPGARREILINTKLSAPDKAALTRQLDELQARVDDQLAAKKFKISVKAEADQGALTNIKNAFYDTYGLLYDGWKWVFIEPFTTLGGWAWGQIKAGWKNTVESLPKPLKSALDKSQTVLTSYLSGAKAQWSTFFNWLGRGWRNYTTGNMWTGGLYQAEDKGLPGYEPSWIKHQKEEHAKWLKAQKGSPNDFKAGGGGRSASADKYGDPANEKPKPKPKSTSAPDNPLAGLGTGDGRHKKTEAERAAERAEKERLRQEKDAVSDVAKAYEYKAEAAKKAAQAAIEGGRTELDSLKELRDAFKDRIGDSQSELVALGVINDPLRPMIARFEKLIDVAGKSKTIVADARKSFNAAINEAKSAQSAATGARTKSEQLSGLDGVVPIKGGSLETGPLGARIARNAERIQEKWGDKIGSVFYRSCDRLADATVNGATKAFASIMGSRKGDTAARTMARFKAAGIGFAPNGDYQPGDIVYSGGTRKNRAGHVQIIGPDGRFFDQYGRHKDPTTTPSWVVRPDGANARGTRFDGYKGGSYSSGVSGDLPKFDLKALLGSLSKVGTVDAAWGSAVRNTDKTSARFMWQTSLASEEFQGQLKKIAALAHITYPQLVKLIREFANGADLELNKAKASETYAEKRKASVEAALASINELGRARRAVGSERNPFSGILQEFEPGGKYAEAPTKKLALLDAQRRLSVAQSTQATKESVKAEQDKIAVLTMGGRALSAATIGTNKYEIALERAQGKLNVWRSDPIVSLLEESKTYDIEGGKLLELSKRLALTPFVAAPGAAAKARAEGMGLKGRAAGGYAKANADVKAITDAQEKSADVGRDEARRKAILEANDALATQLKLVRTEGEVLRDLTLSEQERADKIERQTFVLNRRASLMKEQGLTPLMAAVQAELEARQNDAIKRQTRQNDGQRAYNGLLDETKRSLALLKGQTKITLDTPGYSPKLERELAIFEKKQELLAKMREQDEKPDSFKFNDKLRDFTKTFDAQAVLKSAGTVRSILDEASQAALTFGDSSITAGIKFRTAFGDLSTQTDKVKASLIDATAKTAMWADATSTIEGAKSQVFALNKELETARIARYKPISPRAQQELDWKYSDLETSSKNPTGTMDAKAKAILEMQRNNVRLLLDSIQRETKVSTLTDKIGGAFDSMFDSVLSRQRSWGSAMKQSLNSTLLDMANQVIKSQFRNAITSLFTSALGGGSKGSLLSSVVPFAGGSISDGIKGRGGLFGGSVSGGYGLKLSGAPTLVGATGVDRVARDGQIIVAHRGEKLLAAAEAESYRQQQQARLLAQAPSSSSGGSVTNNYYTHNGNVVANSPERYEKEVRERAQQRNTVRYARSEKQRKAGHFVASGPRF